MSFVLPKNFEAAGVAAGIKKSGDKDLALLVSRTPAVMAGTFTTNNIKAAPVKLCMQRIAEGAKGYAVVVNSGNANACTGSQGTKDAAAMAEMVGQLIEVNDKEVFVCSTGHIGDVLPMDRIKNGIRSAVDALSADGAESAVEAIMTTDTCPKMVSEELELDGQKVVISGMAKGAGMIEPNMATMLAFIMTDAAVAKPALQSALKTAVNKSFNRITVDGDRSTNDTVLCMANGCAGNKELSYDNGDWQTFCTALEKVCFALAMKIVGDGEGAKKIVTVTVEGAATDEEAETASRAIANSLLVKTSWVRNDVNWGRVMDALGYSGVILQETSIDVFYNEHAAVLGGLVAETPLETLQAVVDSNRFTLRVHLHIGIGESTVYTCECTEEYVRINY